MSDDDQKEPDLGLQKEPDLSLDDDDVLAELDAEFAELTSEIERITALPQEWAKETQIQQLTMLRDEWLKKARAKKNRPQWQAKVEEALAAAFEKVVREGTSVDLDGKMSFKLDQQTLGQEAMPVIQALLQGLTQTIAEKVITLNLKGTHTPRTTPEAAESDSTEAAANPPDVPSAAGATASASAADTQSAQEGAEAQDDSAETSQSESPQSDEAKVQIKLDLGSILGALFKQVTPKTGNDSES